MSLLKLWFTIFAIGAIFFPITSNIFKSFNDKGWLFSKVIGICISSWLMWILSYIKILPFTRLNSILIVLFFIIIDLIYFIIKNKKKALKEIFNNKNNLLSLLKNIMISEALFIVLLLLWNFIKGYNPFITSTTEQFMDYGYLNSILNVKYMPPEDIWLSSNPINYYYFGQYISAFICKVSGLTASEGYNYIIVAISSFSFVLPFSIAFNIFKNHIYENFFKSKVTSNKDNNKNNNDKKKNINIKNKNDEKGYKFLTIILPLIVAIFVGTSTSLGGTLHYSINKLVLNKSDYSFIDEVRYIGYKPEVDDKTATEVPAYSNIVGDLHAHYIDLVFSLTTIALLAQYFILEDNDDKQGKFKLKKYMHLLLIAFMLAIQKMTNYWDFPIYIVIIGAVIIAKELICGKFNKKNIFKTLLLLISMIIIEELISLPFNLDLVVNGTKVLFTGICSPFYKLLVKWGLPTFLTFAFLIIYLVRFKKSNLKFKEYLNNNLSDLFMIIIALCAFGLVLLPEVIYLKDIYGDDFKRFNTMFKLAYQAYILFSITSSYILFTLLLNKKKVISIIALILIIINSSTFGYGITAMSQYYKNCEHKKISAYNAEWYIKDQLPEDYKTILWIRDNIERDKIIAEASKLGNSYSTYSRISIFTGNPTVLGWVYHEWIWRYNEDYSIPEELTKRNNDLNTLYTSKNEDTIKNIINVYNINYIYIGTKEYETYSNINTELLTNIGEVVYNSGENYLIKVK